MKTAAKRLRLGGVDRAKGSGAALCPGEWPPVQSVWVRHRSQRGQARVLHRAL